MADNIVLVPARRYHSGTKSDLEISYACTSQPTFRQLNARADSFERHAHLPETEIYGCHYLSQPTLFQVARDT